MVRLDGVGHEVPAPASILLIVVMTMATGITVAIVLQSHIITNEIISSIALLLMRNVNGNDSLHP